MSNSNGHLRVMFLLRVEKSDQANFLAEYDKIRYHVAAIDGHLVDQVCQSLDDPCQWLIASEWESPQHFLDWEAGAGHRQVAGGLISYASERQSLRFVVRQQTLHGEVS
jgi:heme-degrading monooxygenase HmoA